MIDLYTAANGHKASIALETLQPPYTAKELSLSNLSFSNQSHTALMREQYGTNTVTSSQSMSFI